MDHPDPLELLRKWVGTKESIRAAARILGCHPSYLSLLLNKKRGPGLDLAFAIEAHTQAWDEGPILARWWAVDTKPATGTEG